MITSHPQFYQEKASDWRCVEEGREHSFQEKEIKEMKRDPTLVFLPYHTDAGGGDPVGLTQPLLPSHTPWPFSFTLN